MQNHKNEVHGPDRKGFDFSSLERCLAKNRSGNNCKQPAMKNGKCYYHGGRSTGPKTIEGKKTSSKNSLKHGVYTQEEKNEDQKIRDLMSDANKLYRELIA